jgi:hypothetical protein
LILYQHFEFFELFKKLTFEPSKVDNFSSNQETWPSYDHKCLNELFWKFCVFYPTFFVLWCLLSKFVTFDTKSPLTKLVFWNCFNLLITWPNLLCHHFDVDICNLLIINIYLVIFFDWWKSSCKKNFCYNFSCPILYYVSIMLK